MLIFVDVIFILKNVCGLGVYEYFIKFFKNVFVYKFFIEWFVYKVDVFV